MSIPTTYVLGFGSVAMGDDGFGPAAVRAFEAEYVVGLGVTVVDLGTPSLDLMPWLADADRVIVVDTVTCDLAPGTLRIYRQARRAAVSAAGARWTARPRREGGRCWRGVGAWPLPESRQPRAIPLLCEAFRAGSPLAFFEAHADGCRAYGGTSFDRLRTA